MVDTVLLVLGVVSAVSIPLVVGWLADRPCRSASSQHLWRRSVNVYDLAWLQGGLLLAKRAAAVELCARGVVHSDHELGRLVIDLPLPRDAHSVERTVYGDVDRSTCSTDSDHRASDRIQRSLLDVGLLVRSSAPGGAILAGVVMTLLPLAVVVGVVLVGDLGSTEHLVAVLTAAAGVFGGLAALASGGRLRDRRTVEGGRFVADVRREHSDIALSRSRFDDIVRIGNLSVSPATLSVALYGRNLVAGWDPGLDRSLLAVRLAEAEATPRMSGALPR
jgi:uncharacterized protein (TIGR04222 family)